MIHAFFFLAVAILLWWLNMKVGTSVPRKISWYGGWLALVAAVVLAVREVL